MSVRLDVALVERGLARSRAQAQTLIKSGSVLVDATPVRRPSVHVTGDSAVELTDDGAHCAHWVGRGAHKLRAALTWHPEVARAVDGGRCLDIGASTGGFTQVLLEAGARAVTALDVGHGQLAETLREDRRVEERSGLNIRDAQPADLGRFDVLVSDVSFISLRFVLPPARKLALPLAHLVFLVKPQFEVGRERVGEGVVTRPEDWRRALNDVMEAAAAEDLHVHGLDLSPIAGGEGNREFLLWLRPGSAPSSPLPPPEVAARVHAVTVRGSK